MRAFLLGSFLILTTFAPALGFEITPEQNGRVLTLTLSGLMRQGADYVTPLRRAVEKYDTKVINFQNLSGGSTVEAAMIHDLIRAKRLDTVFSGRCVSACTMMFMAGQKRQMSNRFQPRFGVHKMVVNGATFHGQDEWFQNYFVPTTNGRFDRKLLNLMMERFESYKDMIWFHPPDHKPPVVVCRKIDGNHACRNWTGSDTDIFKSGLVSTTERFRLD